MSIQQYDYHRDIDSILRLLGPHQNSMHESQVVFQSEHRVLQQWYENTELESSSEEMSQTSDLSESMDSDIHSESIVSQSPQRRRHGWNSVQIHDMHSGGSSSSYFTNGAPYGPSPKLAPTTVYPLQSTINIESNTVSTQPQNNMNSSNVISPVLLLLDADLWNKFHEQHNEMIITKSGRRLFPSLRFKAINLDPDSYYSIRIDFERVIPNRFRFHNGGWEPVELFKSSNRLSHRVNHESFYPHESYTHPDGFQLGSYWMANPILFDKVKLTNKDIPSVATTKNKTNLTNMDKPLEKATKKDTRHRNNSVRQESSLNDSNSTDPLNGNVDVGEIDTFIFHMASFHKYCPRIYLTQLAKDPNDKPLVTMYHFKRTEFMAVTHYQNFRVNDLKKLHNPHARGFRGIIGKVLPPVKIPNGKKHQEVSGKCPSLTALRPKSKRRARHNLKQI
ncbi:hypothetical protein FBU30_001214 [Linnemannia zychae]|nr:hypothetical protein FBU30_001214 [Linnemannia zychae]